MDDSLFNPVVKAKSLKEYDQELKALKEENFGLKIRIYMLEEEAATLSANTCNHGGPSHSHKAEATLTTSVSTPHLAALGSKSLSAAKKPTRKATSIYDDEDEEDEDELSEDSDRGSHSTASESDSLDEKSSTETLRSKGTSASRQRSQRFKSSKQRSKSERNLRHDSNEYETLNKLVSWLFSPYFDLFTKRRLNHRNSCLLSTGRILIWRTRTRSCAKNYERKKSSYRRSRTTTTSY